MLKNIIGFIFHHPRSHHIENVIIIIIITQKRQKIEKNLEVYTTNIHILMVFT